MAATVQSVERAFAILETFDEEHPVRSAAEIARVAGLARPTTYRMLQTLRELGYVRNVHSRFEVTPRVLRLAAGFIGATSIGAVSNEVIARLVERLDARVWVGVLDEDAVVVVASATPRSALRATDELRVGQRLEATQTSAGRLLLAHVASDDQGAGALAPEAIAEIRALGYATIDAPPLSTAVSVAAPIRDRQGTITAAIVLETRSPDGSAGGLPGSEIDDLQEAASQISARI